MADEVIQEFLAESWENLSQLDTSIVCLEKEPTNSELLASIFRTIHTIKGTCGFLGLNGLGRVAHAAENVLGKMRDGTLDVNSSAISIVLEGVDRIKDLLQGLEATGEEPNVDSTRLIHKLDLLASLGEPTAGRGATPRTPDVIAPPPVAIAAVVETATPVVLVESVQVAPVSVAPAIVSISPPNDHDHEPNSSGESKKSVSELSIRVNVDVLDRLMNLVGELVLTRNQLLQMVRGEDESKYAGPISHLNRVTADLQEGLMKTRMQPIGNAWSKLPRLVRDLSRVTGKQIVLEMQGAETELDRTVLDAIKDPLTHMVRNSADHGIEAPDIRRSIGKHEAGRLKLNAFHQGGHVIICIDDDGAGINRQRVIKKALEQRLITEAEATHLPDAEIIRLIFRAGFSTADQVTSVSGRGVGMDVVRTEIERIGGTVEMTSVPGQGTKVRIKIPLTLAIISALVVESGGQCFAIPQLGVVELVRLTAEDRRKIERIHRHEVFRLRDRLLPLIHLHKVLKLDGHQLNDEDDINIVVVQVGEEQFGLMVDEVFDTQEIVVKPVGALLKKIKVYQGTTILGDGRVIMILDVAGVATQMGGISAKTQDLEKLREPDGQHIELTSLLLFNTAQGDTMAVPLALVSRLEELPIRTLERRGDRLVVQYRGQLLPLVPISGLEGTDSTREMQPIVVFSDGQQALGLMVDRIQDIIEEPLIIRMPSTRPGVLGTAIIAGQATDVLDTQHYFLQVNPDWFRRTSTLRAARKVLVIDDSMFFRQLVRTALESEGYRATVVDGAERAMELLDKGDEFDVILCDIEMPGMDGCQFAEWCRKRQDTLDVPLVAITSLDADVHGTRIMAAGFDRLLIKFHPQQLRDTLSEIIEGQDRMMTGISA